jgi:uncharacterized protein DUF899
MMMHHRIVTREEWLAARKAHLAKEKELTRLRDQLSAERPQSRPDRLGAPPRPLRQRRACRRDGRYVPADGSTGTSA